jgi:OOP family OmpA-OmpF porin
MLAFGFARLASACLATAVACTPLSAMAADAPGCQDPVGLKRFEGSRIVMCEKREFTEYTLPTGKNTGHDFNSNKGSFDSTLNLQGRLS